MMVLQHRVEAISDKQSGTQHIESPGLIGTQQKTVSVKLIHKNRLYLVCRAERERDLPLCMLKRGQKLRFPFIAGGSAFRVTMTPPRLLPWLVIVMCEQEPPENGIAPSRIGIQ